MTPTPPPVRAWLSDMDGVLVHEEEAIPAATVPVSGMLVVAVSLPLK